ncbi:MAG: bifunctional folylpolyglutamate synthase/dihydrofolate synthase [Bilophila wadsworthia]
MRFHSFDDVQDHLDALGLFHMDFGLDRMRNALDALGLLTPFVTVQIVGTNGKGSTSTFLSCVARAHGLKVGLYTSPHFVTPRERIRINGTMLPADRWPVLADRVMEAAPNLTYFEFLTALGLLAFAEAGVDLVVMEAGLGGHYDATTAMPVQAVCFTPIGMDHEKILGPTLTDIASDKSQAMRPGVPAFTAPQEAEALDCLLRTAQEKGAELRETASLPFPQSALGLAGPHQRVNARLAIAVWDWLVISTMAQYARNHRQGLASAHFPGRFQRIQPATACRP